MIDDSVVDKLKNENLTSLKTESINLLKKRGFITNKSAIEEYNRTGELFNIIYKYQFKHKFFTFLIAYDCNFRCPYCYESKISGNGNSWTGETFTKEKITAAFSLIDKLDNKVEKHPILLYGGESLLIQNYPIVKEIVDSARDREYKIGAITNGYTLDGFKDLLGNNSISFLQITIDGNKESHNKRRRHYMDGDTFDKIIENIFIALGSGTKINLRINIDKENINDLESFTDMILNMGLNEYKNFSSFIEPVHSNRYSDDFKETCIKDENLMNTLNVYEHLNMLKKSDPRLSFIKVPQNHIKILIKNALESKTSIKFKGSYCGIATSNLILDPRGDIYSCLEFVGQPEEIIGSYYPHFDIDTLWNNKISQRHTFNIESCCTCKYSLLCGGGCAALAKKKYGNIMTNFCNQFPALFKRYVIDAYYEMQYNL